MGANDIVVDSNKVLESDSTRVKGIKNNWKFLSEILLNPREDAEEAKWDDPLASELDTVISDYLILTVQNVINKVAKFGKCDEKTAELLVLRSRHIQGGVDIETGMIHGALSLLKKPDLFDDSIHHKFENLDGLVDYTMVEMVCEVREVNPSLTVAEAMWYLLIFDLNKRRACMLNKGHLEGEDPEFADSQKTKREMLRQRASHVGKSHKWRAYKAAYSYNCKGQPDELEKLLVQRAMKSASTASTVAQSEIKRDERDELILLLDPIVEALKKELKHWSDWTITKIKQITHQSKIAKHEIQEGKRIVEEQSSKMMKLEAEKATLRMDIYFAKMKAKEAGITLKKAKLREQETAKNVQLIDSNRQLLETELSYLKRNATDHERQLEKAKIQFKQLESLWMKEDGEKKKTLEKVKLLQERRQEVDVQKQKKVSDISERAEKELQVHRVHIKVLEAKIAGLNSPIKRERECVMCLDKEKSVVFLPCAHQIICADCNLMHEKQGMDCPSCRATIKTRIHPKFANI